MIRVIVYLLIVAALAFGAVWLAERPGDVAITWQGWRIETSVMVLAAAAVAIALATAALWSLARTVLRAPSALARQLRARRAGRGYQALSQGLVAVASGDVGAARKLAEEARRTAPGEPLTLLLGAQAAQLAGDRASAERAFHVMANRADTRLLGLHGLYIEAQRRADPMAARHYAEEAAAHNRPPGWAGQAALEFRCASGDWTGALDRLDRNARSGLIEKAAHRRARAVLLTARALAAVDSERVRARELAVEAAKLAPALVPAAALAGTLLGEAGELRKAARIIEAAWKESPHPDLAEAYAHLRPGDSARQRLARIQTLTGQSSGDIESALAVARAAIDAQEFAVARAALHPLVASPTRRVALLMAELEERERGDQGRAREWMRRALSARRDPAWTADGFVAERWMPVSPLTGRLDAFEWKDPLSGLERPGTMIESMPAAGDAGGGHPPPAVTFEPREPPAPVPATRSADDESSTRPVRSAAAEMPGRAPAGSGSEPDARSPARAEGWEPARQVSRPERDRIEPVAPMPDRPAPELPPRVARLDDELRHEQRLPAVRAGTVVALPPRIDKVIPLVHAPDDPGPDDPGPDREPQIEPLPEPAAESQSEGWNRIRRLLRP